MSLASAAHLEQTQFFIDENPSSVVVRRRTRTSDGAGGFVLGELSAAPALTPQTMRLVGSTYRRDDAAETTADGRVVFPTHAIIAMPTADLKRWDVLFIGGRYYEVVSVSDHPEWRLQGRALEFQQ